MKLTKRIELPNSTYVFELSLESKTVEAHSLMSDNKDDIIGMLNDLDNVVINDIIEMADQHQQKLKG